MGNCELCIIVEEIVCENVIWYCFVIFGKVFFLREFGVFFCFYFLNRFWCYLSVGFVVILNIICNLIEIVYYVGLVSMYFVYYFCWLIIIWCKVVGVIYMLVNWIIWLEVLVFEIYFMNYEEKRMFLCFEVIIGYNFFVFGVFNSIKFW